MATHSSILAWTILWTEEPGSPWGRKWLGNCKDMYFLSLDIIIAINMKIALTKTFIRVVINISV